MIVVKFGGSGILRWGLFYNGRDVVSGDKVVLSIRDIVVISKFK